MRSVKADMGTVLLSALVCIICQHNTTALLPYKQIALIDRLKCHDKRNLFCNVNTLILP